MMKDETIFCVAVFRLSSAVCDREQSVSSSQFSFERAFSAASTALLDSLASAFFSRSSALLAAGPRRSPWLSGRNSNRQRA
jgi:hypothetical protein